MSDNRNDEEKMERLKQKYMQPEMTTEQVDGMKKRIKAAKRERRRQGGGRTVRYALAAIVAVVALFVALPNMSASVAYAMSDLPVIGKLVEVVTFRNYQYADDRHNADIEVPELVPGVTSEAETDTEANGVQENLEQSAEEINAEIREITDQLIAEFKAGLAEDGGYQDMMVTSEILNTSENYFTLKLICYQAAGSGAEWDYFYTIDLATGKRLALADLFAEGADYLTPISENIKDQMRQQMAEDEDLMYWIDTDDGPDWDFQGITDETSFYLNADDNVVICFNEGDVAPMYMGTVEFEIPAEVIADIRR